MFWLHTPGTSSVTELWGIYLLSAYHGSGLGQRLLEATIGTENAMLWVAQDNPRAQAFYRRNGFSPNGTRKVVEDWEGIPLIQMSR
ncbi:GNAT family N-acetyltransferase [Arthrobacter sp. Bi83]|uniref:GNAT family N-acetyltransferase n=1 Tax=Arthrobacter sp. Bi83 TaxID=2822353 RepID=UPI0033AFA72D